MTSPELNFLRDTSHVIAVSLRGVPADEKTGLYALKNLGNISGKNLALLREHKVIVESGENSFINTEILRTAMDTQLQRDSVRGL